MVDELEKQAREWKESWFVVASEGDGAESVIVLGLEAAKAELTRLMWNDNSEPDENTKGLVAELDEPDNWSTPYPDYLPMAWGQRFEDGGVSVTRITNDSFATQVRQKAIEECAKVAEAEGAIPQSEGGNLMRWDACDNVAREIRLLAAPPVKEKQ